jgi:tetratricopeptide (TPR) repeat protein
VLKLVYGQQVPEQRAEAAVAGMEAYLKGGILPGDSEVRAFLENLALDALLAEAGPAGLALLRAATLFTLPVPAPVIDELAAATGGSAERLRGLGLLDPYPDLRDPGQAALAASPLAAGRLTPLTADEQAALAAVAAGPLLAAWAGPAPAPARSPGLDLELARLALLAGDPDVTAASAAGAVLALRDGPAAHAAGFARQAIALLDAHGRAAPLGLLRQAADAEFTSGDGPAGEALLARAAAQAETPGGEAGPLSRASVMFEQAQRLIIRGEPDQALNLLHGARQLFTDAGAEREATVVTGSIADIAYQRGDYDEAVALQEKRLEVNKQLGDLDGIAAASWDLAQIDLARQDYQAAAPRLIESFQIFTQLRRPDGIAIVGSTLGQLLLAADNPEAGRQVLRVAMAAAEKIGQTDLARQISQQIPPQPPDEET